MSEFRNDLIERLRACVAAGLPAPHDLASKLLDLHDGWLHADLTVERDRYLREAARLLDGSDWRRAGELAAAAAAVDGQWSRLRHVSPVGFTLRDLLIQARSCARIPLTQRRLYEIVRRY
jgi:hypothetical protein